MNRTRYQQSGFTLIELVIVIVITSIVATMISQIILRPFQAYTDSSRRAELVGAANAALVKMAWDIQNAVPNSVRIPAANDQVLELMPVLDAGRYREGNAGDANGLAVALPDNSFNHLGDMPNYNGARIVVYNTSATQLYDDATGTIPANNGVITELGNTVTITDCDIATCGDLQSVDRITLSNPHRFDQGGTGSPRRRFYLTREAVTYHCDPTTNHNILRYSGYDITSSQTEARATLAATANSEGVVTDHVTGCSFSFQPGSVSYRTATVTIRLTLEDQGERIELLKEVHIWNAP